MGFFLAENKLMYPLPSFCISLYFIFHHMSFLNWLNNFLPSATVLQDWFLWICVPRSEKIWTKIYSTFYTAYASVHTQNRRCHILSCDYLVRILITWGSFWKTAGFCALRMAGDRVALFFSLLFQFCLV